jgi:hypothetical protein
VGHQLILQHHAVSVRDQVGQQLKDLGPHRNPHTGPVQLITLGIDDTDTKPIAHGPVFPPCVEAGNTWERLAVASVDRVRKMSPKYHQSYTKLSCFPSPVRFTFMVAA